MMQDSTGHDAMQPVILIMERLLMEGKRSWWIGRASNPVGDAMHRRVGSTPIPLRHLCPMR